MEFCLHKKYTVTKVSEALTLRLTALGITEGTEVVFVGRAPLGDPVLTVVRGVTYAFRKRTLDAIAFSL